MNLASDLDRVSRERPDHPVLIYENGTKQWTFAELDLNASRVATGLEKAGIRPGDRVAIVMGNLPEHVACWYGAVKAGAVPVDLNFLLGDEDWAYILRDCAPSAIFAGPEFAPRVAAVAAGLSPSPRLYVARGDGSVGEPLDRLGAGTPRRDAVERAPEDLAAIAYTSGTTGFPKGVMHGHGLLGFQLETVRETNGFGPDDIIVNLTPFFPLHGWLLQPAMAVHVGCSLLVIERFSPQVLAEASRNHAITTGTFVSAIVVALLQMPEDERPVFPKGRAFLVGGAPLHPEVRDRFERTFGVTTLQGFGSTEVMGAVAMERTERRAPWGSCGEIWPGARELVRVVDEQGRDVPPGEVGEFVVHKSRATMGYWGRPELTEEAFLDGTWYRMGDIGRIDEQGFVYLLDRKKDMIIRGGFNIYSAELERVLNEHEAVAEVTIVGVPHERLGEVPKAFIVLRPGFAASEELADALRESCVQRLGKLKVPEEVEFVALGDLPRNAMGKVLKRELRRRLHEGT